MNKYEEALQSLANTKMDIALDEWCRLSCILQEALDKAAKFDELIAARGKATGGIWRDLSNECKLSTEDGAFVTLAANITEPYVRRK